MAHPDEPTSMIRRASSGRAAVMVLCLSLALGACASSAPPTFDLSAPRDFGRIGAGRGQLAVSEPAAVQALNSERVIVRDGESLSFLGGAQWSDRLPALIQARLIETFENGSRVKNVGRPGGALNPDYTLSTELRAFYVEPRSGQAVVAITARLVNSRGQVVAGRVFTASEPVAGIDGPNAARALDGAMGQVLVEIVRWASGSAG